MPRNTTMHFRAMTVAALCTFWFSLVAGNASSATAKQQALDDWRKLTSPGSVPPQAFVKGREVRLYFEGNRRPTLFSADWKPARVPGNPYQLSAARLERKHMFTGLPQQQRGWKEAMVLSGEAGQKIGTDLLERLTPASSNHGVCYEAFFADRVLFRDAQGVPRLASQKEKPSQVIIDHHFLPAESLEMVARQLDEILAANHPEASLFVVLAPDASRFAQPLLIDRQQRHCICLSLAALYDSTESGVAFKVVADGFSALVLESHGVALLKNPISSVARLADAVVQDGIRLLPIRGLSSRKQFLATTPSGEMDLVEWDRWLDRHTGTRLEEGSLRLLTDGDHFFDRLREAIRGATNHISAYVYLLDRDDVAVEIADLLKQRSSEVPVKISYDRICSLIGGLLPKLTASSEHFVPPASMSSYLRKNSKVQVRPFLNPWITVNHSKLFLVDGNHAWIGGMNLGREYLHEWHDVMVEIEGPVVASLESEFRRQWAHAGPGGDLAYARAALSEPGTVEPTPSSQPASKVRRLPTTKGLRKPFRTAVLTSLTQARKYIYLENGYLFDQGVVSSLIKARKRGVEVRVILPSANNFKLGVRSNLAIAERLRRHGVHVYLWPGMTHVKALLVDGWSCLGSANLNQWSLSVCKEENMATSDPAFAARLKTQVFDPDFARAHELTEPLSLNFADRVVTALLNY